MIKHNIMRALFVTVCLCICFVADAQADERLRGTVTHVEFGEETGVVSIELTDSGEERRYLITPETEIITESDLPKPPSARFSIGDLGDVRVGDQVVVTAQEDTDFHDLWKLVRYEITVEQNRVDSANSSGESTRRQ